MDREWGSKSGSGVGAASAQNATIDRRERLQRLALETIDLAKDLYFMRNHLGSYEFKLCLTLHNNEGNYLAHTQGKRHQTNLVKRAARMIRVSLDEPNTIGNKIHRMLKLGLSIDDDVAEVDANMPPLEDADAMLMLGSKMEEVD